MAKEVKVKPRSVEPDGGGFHIIFASGNKQIYLHSTRHDLVALNEMVRIALAKDTKCIVVPMEASG